MKYILIVLLPLFSYGQDFSSYRVKHYHTGNSALENDHVREIYIDKAGTTWITSNHQGLHKIEEGSDVLKHVPFANIKNSWWLNDIEEDSKGRLIMTGYLSHVLIYDPKINRWDSVSFPGHQAWRLAKNKKDVFLIGGTMGSGGGFYIMKDEKVVRVDTGAWDVFHINVINGADALVSYREGTYLFKMKPDGTYDPKGKKVTDLALYETVLEKDGTIWAAA